MIRCLFVFLLLVSALPVGANICAHDQTPAATLLFPFVVFDYNQPWGGETSVLTITNVHSEAQVVHVVLWTDLGVPVIEFNLLLTGYDIQRFNIRDILIDGRLPVTVSERHTSHEGVADNGPVSSESELQADWISDGLEVPEATYVLKLRCGPDHDGYPGNYVSPIPSALLELVRWRLTASQRAWIGTSEDCAAPFENPYEDPRASWYKDRNENAATWMFATADVVHSCRRVSPTDEAYWQPATQGGEARYDNVLTGDVMWISSERSTSMPAVHLEADADLGAVATLIPETGLPISFYGRYSNRLALISDYREPLPTAWSFRHMGAQVDGVDTSILVWKGSTQNQIPPDMSLGADWQAPDEVIATSCNPYTYYSWDEDSNVYTNTTGVGGLCLTGYGPGSGYVCPNLVPLVVQEISIDEFYTVDDNGWMLFLWPASNYPAELGAPATPDHYQTWMGVRMTAWSNHADYLPATTMANSNCFADQTLPRLGVKYDYVTEDGYTTSGTVE